MKKITLAFLTTVMVLAGMLASEKASASHCAGGELTYAWVRDSTYRVTLKFYRDCSGVSMPTSFDFCVTNNAGISTSGLPSNLPKVGPTTRATSNCSRNKCDVPAGLLPGYEEGVFETNVTLPGRATQWKFGVSLSARNHTENLLPDQSTFYIESTLNNVVAQGNSSPTFSVKPVPFVCVNKEYNYNNGVNVDNASDSLAFEMVMPQTAGSSCGPGSNLNFPPPGTLPPGQGYNLTTNPLPTNNSFVLNQYNGQLTFTPFLTGAYGIALRVKQYRGGVLIGTIVRDIQVIVLGSCPPSVPGIFGANPGTSNGINFTSTRTEGCANKPLNLCVRATNIDSNQRLNMISNNTFSAIGSVFTTRGLYTDTVYGCVAWTPTIADTGLHTITYSVTDTNCATNGGVSITQTYSVSLYINPVTTASPDKTICSGQKYDMRVVGGGNWIWNALPGGSGNGSLSCLTCQEPTATPLVTTRYVVVARTSNSFCNINSDTVTVTVAPPVVFTAGPDDTTCVNNSLQLNATPTNGSLGSNYSITWTPATFLNNPNIVDPIVTPNADITYVIKITPAGVAACATYDTLSLTVLQGFDYVKPADAICAGTVIPIDFTGDERYDYTWTPSAGVSDVKIGKAVITPDTSHTYTLTAKFRGCRDSVKSFYVDVQPNPIVYAGPDQTICYGDTIHLDVATVTPSAYPNYTYSWTPAGAFDDPASLNPLFTGFSSATATLKVTTPFGCIGVDSARFTVIAADFLTISRDTVICPGDSAQLRVGGPFQSLVWSNQPYVSDTLSATPYVYPYTTTTFHVTGRDINFCLDTASVTVRVHPGALISLPDSVTIFPGESYAINPMGNGLYFTWFPGGGLSATNISNPVASPSVNTRYFVTARTEAGCTVRDSIDVNVAPDSYVDVPNAFTPGSQPNAILKIVHKGGVKVNTFKIFNRWGAQMFTTTDINEGWNGQFNDKPQPMGVYVYIVDAVTATGRHFYKQGNVTLIR